jgi:hypothetical protein
LETDIEHGGSTMKTAGLTRASLFVLCLATPLAACGGGEGGAPTAEPSPTATGEEPTAARTPSATSVAAATGKIAFHSDRDGNYEIYVMNADGSGQTRLTDNPAIEGSPAWSP